jgi:hypothetical protein
MLAWEYCALRLVVNCFQPSLKLQAKVRDGDRVRRVYDLARTPLARLLASGVLAQTRQEDLCGRAQQLDPLALSCGMLMVWRPPACCPGGRAITAPLSSGGVYL